MPASGIPSAVAADGKSACQDFGNPARRVSPARSSRRTAHADGPALRSMAIDVSPTAHRMPVAECSFGLAGSLHVASLSRPWPGVTLNGAAHVAPAELAGSRLRVASGQPLRDRGSIVGCSKTGTRCPVAARASIPPSAARCVTASFRGHSVCDFRVVCGHTLHGLHAVLRPSAGIDTNVDAAPPRFWPHGAQLPCMKPGYSPFPNRGGQNAPIRSTGHRCTMVPHVRAFGCGDYPRGSRPS